MNIHVIHVTPNWSYETTVDNTALRDYYALTNGGPIEAVIHHPTGTTLYCNEEGLRLGLAPNLAATRLFQEAGVAIAGGVVLGDVVATGPPDQEGYDTDVPEKFLTWLAD